VIITEEMREVAHGVALAPYHNLPSKVLLDAIDAALDALAALPEPGCEGCTPPVDPTQWVGKPVVGWYDKASYYHVVLVPDFIEKEGLGLAVGTAGKKGIVTMHLALIENWSMLAQHPSTWTTRNKV
jgi:hypothetical protein